MIRSSKSAPAAFLALFVSLAASMAVFAQQPSITLNTSPTDYRPIKDGYMVEFRDNQLAVVSEMLRGGS